MSTRDRLNTPFDAMIDIDEKIWPTLTEEQQHAMIDHALTAIELIPGKEGEKFAEATTPCGLNVIRTSLDSTFTRRASAPPSVSRV